MEAISIWVQREARTLIDRDGLTVEQVYDLVRSLAGEADAMATITLGGEAGDFILSVNGDRAIVGLDRPDGIYQYVIEDRPGTTTLMIGRQSTEIKARYVTDFKQMMRLLTEWLQSGGEISSEGWERQ